MRGALAGLTLLTRVVVRQARRAAGGVVGLAGRLNRCAHGVIATVGSRLGVGRSPPVASRHGGGRGADSSSCSGFLAGPISRMAAATKRPVCARRHPRRPPRLTHDQPRHSRTRSLGVWRGRSSSVHPRDSREGHRPNNCPRAGISCATPARGPKDESKHNHPSAAATWLGGSRGARGGGGCRRAQTGRFVAAAILDMDLEDTKGRRPSRPRALQASRDAAGGDLPTPRVRQTVAFRRRPPAPLERPASPPTPPAAPRPPRTALSRPLARSRQFQRELMVARDVECHTNDSG
jgi:hypothetical protein